jgi:hypothetical protein
MPPKSRSGWKAFERRICRLFGGERRGPDNSDGSQGKNDCVDTPGWSIEAKVWKNPTFRAMLEDAIKAENRRKNSNDIPIAIMKKKYDKDENALVVMRLNTFRDYFGK